MDDIDYLLRIREELEDRIRDIDREIQNRQFNNLMCMDEHLARCSTSFEEVKKQRRQEALNKLHEYVVQMTVDAMCQRSYW
jgi:predicted RNase H-like nuclease